jgi:hypothetical protein
MKMLQKKSCFKPRSIDRWLGTVLLCLLAFSAGCVISPRRTLGGGSGSGNPTPTPTPTPTSSAAGTLYVSNQNTNSILRFNNAGTSNGNVAPAGVISGAATQLNSPRHIFVDEATDRLFVANQGTASVLIFDAASTKSGNVAPTRSIAGASTGLLLPAAVAVDATKDLLYVADGRDVLVFTASTANGNVAFTRDIRAGFVIAGMFLDATNNRLFLADSAANAINIYDNASTLNLTVVPSRALTGAATQLNQPSGVGVDAVGKLVVANAGGNSITVYVNAGATNGNAAPAIVISGANTTLSAPAQIAVNKSNTKVEVFVANSNGVNVPVFSDLGATSGNIAPSRNIVGAATSLAIPSGITLDTTK